MRKIFRLPVMLVTLFVAAMFALDYTGWGYVADVPCSVGLSASIFILGVLIIAAGGYLFRKAETTINPVTPEQSVRLVTTGIYNYSRNPMYIGFLVWLIACVIYVGNIVNLILLPLFVMLVNRLYILPEEKALEKLFQDEFREYKKRVRRWV